MRSTRFNMIESDDGGMWAVNSSYMLTSGHATARNSASDEIDDALHGIGD